MVFTLLLLRRASAGTAVERTPLVAILLFIASMLLEWSRRVCLVSGGLVSDLIVCECMETPLPSRGNVWLKCVAKSEKQVNSWLGDPINLNAYLYAVEMMNACPLAQRTLVQVSRVACLHRQCWSPTQCVSRITIVPV